MWTWYLDHLWQVCSSLRWSTSCVWTWTKFWRETRSCRSWTTGPTPCRPEPRSSRAAPPNSRTSTGGKTARWVCVCGLFPIMQQSALHYDCRICQCGYNVTCVTPTLRRCRITFQLKSKVTESRLQNYGSPEGRSISWFWSKLGFFSDFFFFSCGIFFFFFSRTKKWNYEAKWQKINT